MICKKVNQISFLTFQIGIYPCDPKGKEYTEKDNKFVENPEELMDKKFDFKVKIVNARGLPNRFTVSSSSSVKK